MRHAFASLLLSCALLAGCSGSAPQPGVPAEETVFVGSWNLQRFGDAKANDSLLLERYAAVVRDFDVFVVQEVTDKDGTAFDALCGAVGKGYSCLLSSRAGTTSYKEQYGVFVRDGVTVVGTKDYAAENASGFERPPYRVTLGKDGYAFTLYTLHTKPEETPAELEALERLVAADGSKGNTIIIGDLNADCSYYRRGSDFSSWRWTINRDTTAGKSDCAYDRILLNDDMRREYRSSGVLTVGGEGVSDHNAVWVALRSEETKRWWE